MKSRRHQARAGQIVILPSEHLTRLHLKTLTASVLIGIALTMWLPTDLFLRPKPVVRAVATNPTVENSCHWPKHEGEMTVVTVLSGKVICWRWR